MHNSTYEHHIYPNGRQKMVFHPRMMRLRDPNGIVAPHWHDRPEFLLVLEGVLGVNVNGERRTFCEGEIAVVSPNEFHSLFAAEGNRVIYHCVVMEQSLCPSGATYPERSSSPVVVSLFHQMNDELFRERKYRPETMNGFAMAMASMLANEGEGVNRNATTHAKAQIVRSAIQYVNQNFSSPLTLEDISRAAGVSKFYLSHLYREFAGQSIVEHLNYVRCINARGMLSAGVCNVEQAAFQSGFNSLSHFSKTYRTVMGHPPSADLQKHGATRR